MLCRCICLTSLVWWMILSNQFLNSGDIASSFHEKLKETELIIAIETVSLAKECDFNAIFQVQANQGTFGILITNNELNSEVQLHWTRCLNSSLPLLPLINCQDVVVMKYELRYGQSWPFFFVQTIYLRWKEMKRQTRRSRERRKMKNAKTDKISLRFACVVFYDLKKLKSQFIRRQNEVSVMFLQTQHNKIQRRFFLLFFECPRDVVASLVKPEY